MFLTLVLCQTKPKNRFDRFCLSVFLRQAAFKHALQGPLNKKGRKAGEPGLVVLQKEHGLDS